MTFQQVENRVCVYAPLVYENYIISIIFPGAPSKGVSAASDNSVSTSAPKTKPHEATPAPSTQSKLVISGGEGYIDFRIG